MTEMQFKTNAKCGGCTARIGAELAKILPEGSWSFDLSRPEKTLTVQVDIPASDVIRAVEAAGFRAERLA